MYDTQGQECEEILFPDGGRMVSQYGADRLFQVLSFASGLPVRTGGIRGGQFPVVPDDYSQDISGQGEDSCIGDFFQRRLSCHNGRTQVYHMAFDRLVMEILVFRCRYTGIAVADTMADDKGGIYPFR